jgi:hypothetical protein
LDICARIDLHFFAHPNLLAWDGHISTRGNGILTRRMVAMPMPRVIGVFLACFVTSVFAIAKTPEKHRSHYQDQGARMRAARTCQFGKAGRYALLGRRTASGEMLDSVTATAAHRSLPLSSLARVTDLDNGRSVIVKINDRGPYARGRIIDLSPRAGDALDMKAARVAAVPLRGGFFCLTHGGAFADRARICLATSWQCSYKHLTYRQYLLDDRETKLIADQSVMGAFGDLRVVRHANSCGAAGAPADNNFCIGEAAARGRSYGAPYAKSGYLTARGRRRCWC